MKKLAKLLALVLTVALVIPTGITGGSTVKAASNIPIPTGYTYHQSEARAMLGMINAFRASTPKDSDPSTAWHWNLDNKTRTYYNTDPSNTLKPMTYDYDLEKIAMIRATEIIKDFDHGTRANELFKQYGVPFGDGWDGGGENIAYGYSSASSMFKGWREDKESYYGQGHRRNMLFSYTAVGIGCVEYKGTKYWVQIFSHEAANTTHTPAIDGKYTGSSTGENSNSNSNSSSNSNSNSNGSNSGTNSNTATGIGNVTSTKHIAVKEKYDISGFFKNKGLKISKYKVTTGSASVSSKGVVSPKKAGTITVTGYAKEKSKYISKGTVTLKAYAPKLTSMTASRSTTASLDANNYLTGNTVDGKKVLPTEWKSSNKSVASVDAKTGLITIKKAGKVNITAKFGTGSGAVSIKAKLTVKK